MFLTLSVIAFINSLILILTNSMVSFTFVIVPFVSMYFAVGLVMDWISSLFASCVILISAAILYFSFSYIPFQEHKRFSSILITFIISMLLVIFSNNIFFIMLGWDGLGLSSYILVIYYQNSKSSESGALTILSNRVGDIFMLLSIGVLLTLGNWDMFFSKNFPFLILLFVLIASCSKSAQTPFSAWLPAAMAAPTPISALVHSSTLVTAGVFLMLRVSHASHSVSLSTLMFISALTMFFAGISANWEQDMKKIIALSTLSQIAMMMFAISISSFFIAFFHLVTHALFKSTMFLCAGNLIHSTGYQDMRSHGASSHSSPLIIMSLGITSMALMGLPFLSGFYSKDAILESTMFSAMNMLSVFLIMFSVGLTAAYSLRMSNFSSIFILKSQKDKFSHTDKFMFISIIMLTPFSILLGSSLSWFILPSQSFILPIHMKLSISLLIMLGVLSGMLLSYNSKMFNSMGDSSISLWFFNFVSCSYPLKSMKSSGQMLNLDKSWNEISSAIGSYTVLKTWSKTPDLLSSLSMLALSIFFLSPLILF